MLMSKRVFHSLIGSSSESEVVQFLHDTIGILTLLYAPMRGDDICTVMFLNNVMGCVAPLPLKLNESSFVQVQLHI